MSRRLLALALSGLLLTGCFTGKRPHFAETANTGDAAIDAVLTRFDAVTAGPVAASYDVLTKFGNVTRPAAVALDARRRSITIGNIHYIETADTAKRTCTVDLSLPCTEGFDAARISDSLLTVDFYAADTAKRLRRDAQAALGPAVAHNETIAGQAATCADLSLPGGTAVYCVLDSGMLATLDDGDVRVTLTSLSTTVDPSQFVPPTGA
jgi:hypothetical protein